MNDTQRARILDALLAQRHTLAHRWFKALLALDPTLDETLIEAALLPWSERLLAQLSCESFEAETMRNLGEALAKKCDKPKALVRVQELLAHYLVETLTTDEIALLQPRLARLYGELATGFFTKKVNTVKERSLYFQLYMDMRTPLSSIIGFSKVMLKELDGPLTPQQQKDLTNIHSAGYYLLDTLNDMFDLLKLEHDKMGLDPEPLLIQELVNKLQDYVNNPPEFAHPPLGYGQSLETVCADQLGEMYADPWRLQQTLMKLVTYLSRLTEQGETLRLAVSRERNSQANEVIVFLFKSTALRDRFPHPYPDVGLTIAQGLINLMGGTLVIESGKETGNLLTLLLPATPP